MFGNNIVGGASSFTLGKVLGGISKGLTVVNQVIPLYKDAKPMIGNVKSAWSVVKNFATSRDNKINDTKKVQTETIKQEKSTNTEIVNVKGTPVFFQ